MMEKGYFKYFEKRGVIIPRYVTNKGSCLLFASQLSPGGAEGEVRRRQDNHRQQDSGDGV